jgi:hypothetical protein
LTLCQNSMPRNLVCETFFYLNRQENLAKLWLTLKSVLKYCRITWYRTFRTTQMSGLASVKYIFFGNPPPSPSPFIGGKMSQGIFSHQSIRQLFCHPTFPTWNKERKLSEYTYFIIYFSIVKTQLLKRFYFYRNIAFSNHILCKNTLSDRLGGGLRE